MHEFVTVFFCGWIGEWGGGELQAKARRCRRWLVFFCLFFTCGFLRFRTVCFFAVEFILEGLHTGEALQEARV